MVPAFMHDELWCNRMTNYDATGSASKTCFFVLFKAFPLGISLMREDLSNPSLKSICTVKYLRSCYISNCLWQMLLNPARFVLRSTILGPVHTNPFSNENRAVLLRIRLSSTLQRRKRSPKTEPFANALQSGAIWKRCFLKTLFSSVDGENDAIWKRWRHQNRHDRAPDHSTVSIQNGGQTLPCGFSLDRNDFQSFDALASAFNPAEAPLRFDKKETRYFKASDLASFGKNEDKTTLSKPAPCFRFWLLSSCSWHRLEGKYQRILNHNNTQQQRIKNGANFAGR